ncbi:hypothetical protein PsorP6_019323 [Peronosclerospora sorghi]|nr:hypothetical protein PsorP6_019323 [Peronosclerospora sorghi]
MIAAAFSAEVQKVEAWDGKGLWHTYRHSFKLSLTSGVVFNVDADSEEDKQKWIEYIQIALKGTEAAAKKCISHASEYPNINELTPGGLMFAEKKYSPPKFQNDMTCCHHSCHVRFDSAGKRQHHCRNCGGSVCSDHSSRFAIVQHLHINHAVRLCMGCYRVQRFVLCLNMLLQPQLHIRLATAVYWLTRAAIDDSCGWGFGQSELCVPDFLLQKMSLCKLLMINEHRVFITQIHFIEELCAMTERLRFCPPDERKKALNLELEKLELPKEAYYPLGSCDNPLQRLHTIAKDEGTVFTTRARAPTLIFFEVAKLISTCGSSAWLHRGRSLNFGAQREKNCNSNDINREDVFATSEIDVAKNAIEMATSSDLAQVIAMNTFSSDGGEVENDPIDHDDLGKERSASSANEDSEEEELRDRVGSDPPPPLVALARVVGKKKRRGRSGSLMSSTTKSLDSIIATCADTIKIRRNRSNSEGSGSSGLERLQKNKIGIMLNEVENFTNGQLISIAQNMEISMLKSNPSAHGIFTGKEAVDWMTKNEIVSNTAHALWLGSELLRCGALEKTSLSSNLFSGFEANDEMLYRLRSESSTIFQAPGENSMHDLDNPRILEQSSQSSEVGALDQTDQERSMKRTLSRITLRAPETKVDIANVADAVDVTLNGSLNESAVDLDSKASKPQKNCVTCSSDDRRSIASNGHGSSFLLKFEPEVALAAMNSVEQAVQQYVVPREDVTNIAQINQNLQVLREQLSIVYEFVIEKRKRLLVAVESAFGESFEEKKERLRETSSLAATSESKHWDLVAFIVKSNDDLRQEVLCQQIIRQLQDIFENADLPLRLLPYEIIATSASTGIIEYVKNAVSLDALKKRDNYTTLADHFLKTYGQADSPSYRTAMTNFVRSMAAYSLACYFLQIKDRHNGNIMIDSNGHVIHIDFGFILGIAPGGRFSLETAPFKLTGEMVDAMGGTQSDYFKAYVIFLIQGFLALQVFRCVRGFMTFSV